ncbi:MAG TPA: DUF1080 domain-containing protein, partial [Bryobacteraceae bacterium]|nr:DUF1080 domain-containing protein [Bryobacteraceae bacterium]
CGTVVLSPFARGQHKLVHADNGTFGYRDTPKQPWSGYRVHDPDRPLPKKIDPGGFSTDGRPGRPPSDAIVLFDGKDLSRWKPNPWKVENGYLEATTGTFETVDEFGSIQVHLEWRAPDPPEGGLMDRGNNGVLLMGLCELQIFDATTKIYPDGQAAAVYGQTPPLVTASRKPGQWEVYDIIFIAPEFDGDKLTKPARVTVLHNGVLVHHNQEIYGTTPHAALAGPYPAGKVRGPLALLAHKNPVRFRNIWVRPLSLPARD